MGLLNIDCQIYTPDKLVSQSSAHWSDFAQSCMRIVLCGSAHEVRFMSSVSNA